MKILKFIPIVILIFSLSCKKDDNKISINEIVLGDYSNMIINKLDTIIIGGYYDPQYLDIDFNNDGIDDIGLVSGIGGSPGVGGLPYSYLFCLHKNVLLNGFLSNDTIFLNRSTYISVNPKNITEIYEYYNYACNKIQDSDSLIEIRYNIFKILPKDSSVMLSKKDFFNTDTITLSSEHIIQPFWNSTSQGPDTVIYKVERFYTCRPFSLIDNKYIGFKIIEKEDEKLGWIKLKIIDNFKISLIETAVQE